MFQALTTNLNKIFDKIKSRGALTESQIDEAMRDIRIALLEADVALPVARDFINSVKEKAIGREVIKAISPGQMVVKIIHEELINILSSPPEETALNLKVNPPANLLMVGLQGGGKTTASAKLALKLKNQNKKVLLVSLDTYRPAAQEQLEILARSINIDSLPIVKGQFPIDIAKRALDEGKLSAYDVVIYDTAGRLHIDNEMIDEAQKLKSLLNPIETILVVDSMIGQDAVTIASNFEQKLGITGVILSRIDGDSRGGAALSIKHVTNKPIKFLSAGEKLTALEEFNAERLASRILDMGDIIAFVEKTASVIDQKEAEKTANKLKKGKFDLDDYLSQLKTIQKIGGLGGMMNFLPGVNKIMDKIDRSKIDEKLLLRQEAIILSMTKKERRNYEILNASRKKRIADGSGTSVQQVNTLLKQYRQISEMMKKVSKMNPKNLMRGAIGKLFS
jgi:signal recognition particle subunit SRP54